MLPINRTTLELKLGGRVGNSAAAFYQSYHTGIETSAHGGVHGFQRCYQSYHTGIETNTPELRTVTLPSINRTTLELKHWQPLALQMADFTYQSYHTGIETTGSSSAEPERAAINRTTLELKLRTAKRQCHR